MFRCVIFKNRSATYTAECIDLDITTYAPTPFEAAKSLNDAMLGYLEVGFQGEIKGLVPRPSPWNHRFRYHVFALRAAFSNAHRTYLVRDWPPDLSSR